MDLAMGWITYGTEAGPVPAYRARPAAARDPLPAVVVIQEAWGVDEHIMDVARRVATAGYLALAPDLYAAGGERPQPLRAERMEAVKRFVNSMPPGAWTDSRARQEALDRLPEPERDAVTESMAASARRSSSCRNRDASSTLNSGRGPPSSINSARTRSWVGVSGGCDAACRTMALKARAGG